MTKRDFVHRYVERRFDRAKPDIERLVREGERLWQRLTERGYGARQERGPREHVDWYALLSPQQREWFDQFWDAFAFKHGKQGAAMRWSQINPPEDLARHIIEAAAAEATRKLPDGQARKMAQGWLAERRWEDFETSASADVTDDDATRRDEIARLNAELLHVEQLHARTSNEEIRAQLAEQIDDLRRRREELELV